MIIFEDSGPSILKPTSFSIFCWYCRNFVGTNDILVGLHVPTDFQMYRQNSEKALLWGQFPPPPPPSGYASVLERIEIDAKCMQIRVDIGKQRMSSLSKRSAPRSTSIRYRIIPNVKVISWCIVRNEHPEAVPFEDYDIGFWNPVPWRSTWSPHFNPNYRHGTPRD